MKNIFFILTIAALLTGCRSLETVNNPQTIIDSQARFVSHIDKYLDENRPFAAYQFLSANNEKNEYYKESYNEKIFSSIRKLYEQSKEEKKYIESVRILESLEKIGRTDIIIDPALKNELLYRYVENLYEQESYVISLGYFLEFIKEENPSRDVFTKYADVAVLLNNDYALNLLINKMRQNNYEIDNKYIINLEDKDHVSEMIKGTVTIWVDKGIKIESGMGSPDRVIGSGFFIDKRGYLITNYHVIESEVNPEYRGFSRLYIRLPDATGTRVPARVIGWDPVFDVALLKTEIVPEYVFSFSENENFRVGDRIYAIGSPGGLENTITSGIISSKSRKFIQIGDAMQVDVPINPGNSGGPLLNDNNELIGIVFAGIEQFEGINFAIPSHWIMDKLPDLFNGGEVSHSWIGTALHEKNDIVEILYPVPGEPADISGLKNGDILKSINGQPISNIIQAQKILLSLSKDSIIEITYSRAGTDSSVFLSLGERKQKSFDLAIKRDSMRNVILPLFGMEIQKTGNSLFHESYLITKIYDGSIADETGLSVNDPLTIKSWKYDLKERYVLLRFEVKKRKAGFMQSNLQLITSIDKTNVL